MFLQQKRISGDLVEVAENIPSKDHTLMQISKLAFKLRGKITQFSGYVSTGLDKTARRFINEAIYGMLCSQSVMLTEIGRSLQSRVSLKKIEERFCRQLAKPGLWETLHRHIWADASPRIDPESLFILDLSDLRKKYARKMPYLATVRDGSEGGELVNGYWLNQVVATGVDSPQMIPLYQELYSQEAPDFISENRQILQAIEQVSDATENRGIWVIDRGGDRDVLFERLLDEQAPKEFIIRLVGTRHLLYKRRPQQALELARQCKTPYSQTIVKREDGKQKVYELEFGYLPVRLPNHDRPLWMLVVRGYGEKPMMLLTTRPLRRNRSVLWRVLRSYIKRWDIEQSIRFVKQCYDVENIRLLSYTRLRNMMGLLLAVFYFMAVKLDTSAKLTIMSGYVLKAAKRVFGIPDFKYYAMSDGLRAIFTRSPGKLPASPYAVKDPMQLGFGFT